MKVIFILVCIWSHGYSGGQVTIPNFQSEDACYEQGKLLKNNSNGYVDVVYCIKQEQEIVR